MAQGIDCTLILCVFWIEKHFCWRPVINEWNLFDLLHSELFLFLSSTPTWNSFDNNLLSPCDCYSTSSTSSILLTSLSLLGFMQLLSSFFSSFSFPRFIFRFISLAKDPERQVQLFHQQVSLRVISRPFQHPRVLQEVWTQQSPS